MKTTKVVSLGQVRDLLAELDKVRAFIISGRVRSFYAGFEDSEGGESIFLGGVYKQSAEASLAMALKISAARMVEDEESPQEDFRASQFG